MRSTEFITTACLYFSDDVTEINAVPIYGGSTVSNTDYDDSSWYNTRAGAGGLYNYEVIAHQQGNAFKKLDKEFWTVEDNFLEKFLEALPLLTKELEDGNAVKVRMS